MSKSGFDKRTDPVETLQLSEYNFNVGASAIVSAIGLIEDTKWPRPMQTDPARRNSNKMCEYHGTHGHRTEDCRQLREEVAHLFNKGHLREFLSNKAKNHFKSKDFDKQNELEEPQHVIHMIIGDADTPQGPVLKRARTSIVKKKRSRTQEYIPIGTLSFNDEDTEGITQPHNDELVISVLVNKIKIKRVLIDPGSSANIIRSRVIEQLGLQNQLIPATLVLNGYNMACETTKGEIILPINVDGTIQEIKFHVIEGDMRYNALFGSPWIHSMRAVPSTLHQVLKFPTSRGVKIMYGEQPAAKEMFAVEETKSISSSSPIKGTGSE
ncbi:uncharacterized protein [Nicotiana tomentosiformis]|uniref:uncharacterized protein n=1 Tax=Nicotiana tomentosiformis TaxID=4098 RepID=UPI00388C9C00